MHIAFFNRSFYPDTTATGQLLTDLCEDLVREHGCRVSVVAGPPLNPPPGASDSPSARWGLVGRERYRDVEIFRARGTRLAKQRFVGRATNYVTYFFSACYAGLKLDRPDVIVALTDPPIVGLAAWMASLRFRAPLVMSYRDLFPEVAVLLKDFHSETINAMLQRVNRFLVQRAVCNVALGEMMRNRLIQDKGAPPERTIIIPDWADTTTIRPGPRQNAFSDAHGLTGAFVVMHSGNMGLSQSLETLLDAAALLRDIPDVQFVLQGDGVKKPELEVRARELSLRNVRFLPYASRDQLSESFASADVFVVSLQAGLAGYIVPSKLYGILAAGRPFVAAVESTCEVASIASRRACGLVVPPGNAPDMAEAIRAFHRDRTMTAQFGANARSASLDFDRAAQVRKYFDLFRSTCS